MSSVPSTNARGFPGVALVSVVLLSIVLLSYSFVHQNYTFVLIITSLFFFVFILKFSLLPVAVILFVTSFSEWAVELEYLPPQIMWLPEILSGLIFIKALVSKALRKQRICALGWKIVSGFLLITLASLVINGSSLTLALLFLRLLVRYYFLFLAVLNLDFEETAIKRINLIMFSIFLAQLPLSVVKLFWFGSGENPLGLNAHSESALVPLIAIAFLFSFYFIYRKSLLYFGLSLGFVGFAIIGEKRAFIFFLPIVMTFLAWFLKNNLRFVFRYVLLGLFIIFVAVYFSARLIPTLNPQNQIWGDLDLGYILNYAYTYTTYTSVEGTSTGRASSSIFIHQGLKEKGVLGLAFGYGPGSIMKSMFRDVDRRDELRMRFGVEYGVSGWSWLGVQVGYLGAAAYFLLFFLIIRKVIHVYKKETDAYWRSFGLGGIGFSFVMIIMGLVYTPIFTHDAITAFYFCAAAVNLQRGEAEKHENKDDDDSDEAGRFSGEIHSPD